MSAAQHIEWLNLVEKVGPFLAVGVLEEAFPQGLEKIETRKRQRVRSAYDEWRDAVDEGDPQLDALHREWVRLVLEEVLEYESSVLKPVDTLPIKLTYNEPLTGAIVKPDFAVLSGEKLHLLVARYAPDTDLSAPIAGETWAASPLERMTTLCRALGVGIGLVTDGEQWTLISAPADGSSSFGIWYARIWQQEPITLQAFISLLEVRRCFGPSETRLEALFSRSTEHQDELTDTLGEQVRRAVEVLVQALDRADLDRDRELLTGLPEAQLYEAGLTFMMRLVVLLCAEERKLLLLGEPIYDQYYAVSTLRSRLLEDKERLGEEVLERRHDAWSRLLAVCRAVYGGIEHETLRLPALGGSLFNPDRFPFLEGRAAGSSWRDSPAVPLPIDNRTVLLLLTALQVLEHRSGAQFLSYEALDVEQIGHVYEGLLERTVKRVPETTLGLIGSQKVVNPNVPLQELEARPKTGSNDLLAYLMERTGRSETALKSALSKPVEEPLYNRILIASGNDMLLAHRIKPYAHLLRTDSWGEPLAYSENSFIVTLGTGRRETGTHYTPKSLTQPIVRYTLEPLVYAGPCDGRPPEEWRLKSPSALLQLKICDMAMGSGAFLVQTCRWLGERLMEAWEAEEKAGNVVSIEGAVLNQAGGAELLPRDQAERVLIAHRLIANRCLYGVDKNPMAVELAKVSLWLATMMKGRPFSFLDHALKCGDSLLGVDSVKQIENFSLTVKAGDQIEHTFATVNLVRSVEEASLKRRELENLPSNDHRQIEAKVHLHAEAEASTDKVKTLADCLLALELRGLKGEAYEDQRAMTAEQTELAMQKPLQQFQAYAREQLQERRTFHWPVEFPEVFAGGGFDAFVGNPPFMGGQKITGAFGTDYRDFLVNNIANGQRGSADLCAYFFLRAHSLARSDNSMIGMLATSTIAQGGTRIVGLEQLVSFSATTIVRAVPSAAWPGPAALQVAHLWLRRGVWTGTYLLEENPVAGITPFLTPLTTALGKPIRLIANGGKSFQGSIPSGMGFVLSVEQAAALLTKNPAGSEVLFLYLNGDDLNSRFDQSPSRWIINFHDWPLDRTAKGSWMNATSDEREAWIKSYIVPNDYPGRVAADFPDCLRIVQEKVKPERTRKEENGDYTLRFPLYEKWWIYEMKRTALYSATHSLNRVLVCSEVTKHLAFCFVPTGIVWSANLDIFPGNEDGHFAVLQSSLHEIWAREFSATLETRLKYSPGNAYDTYPFPTSVTALSKLGERYHDLRRQIMQTRLEGLTKIYNRFHDPGEKSEDISQLRAVQAEMDKAVSAAYGWDDLELGHAFHETKQGLRWTINPNVRRDFLDRLLALNHQRHEEEVAAGLHEKVAKKSRGKKRRIALELVTQRELIKSAQEEFFQQ